MVWNDWATAESDPGGPGRARLHGGAHTCIALRSTGQSSAAGGRPVSARPTDFAVRSASTLRQRPSRRDWLTTCRQLPTTRTRRKIARHFCNCYTLACVYNIKLVSAISFSRQRVLWMKITSHCSLLKYPSDLFTRTAQSVLFDKHGTSCIRHCHIQNQSIFLQATQSWTKCSIAVCNASK